MKVAFEVFGVVFVVVLVAASSTSATLHCQHCLFEACDSSAEEKIECNVHTVNRLYKHLAALANLEGLLSAPNAQAFQCFQVVVSDGTKNGTVKSCAFAESDICNAWKSGITVESCETCQDEDHCNGLAGEPSPATFAHHSAAAPGLPAGGQFHWIVVAVAAAAALIALQIGSIKL